MHFFPLLLLDPFDVLAGAGIDADHFPQLDEGGALDLGPRLQLDGLGHVGGRVAADPRLAIFDPQVDVVGG